MNLDENDVNILRVLQSNGRLSFRQISERVKVSVPTVSNKIGNMETLGVIKGYKADIDPEKLGELSVVLVIKTKPSDLRSVANQFVSMQQVREVYALSSGKLLLVCTFTDPHWINDFVNALGDIPEIQDYEISNIVNVMKENQRAVIAQGLSVVLQCSECQKEIREESMKLKMNGREYHLCSPSCLNAFESRKGARE
jgi:DNA-binding Lrp family transcriptional regulator